MKCININLPRCQSEVYITVVSDWHLGDKHCKLDEIRDTIEQIKTRDDMYVLINGDIINNAIKSSVSDIYSEKMNPMEQIELAYELLEPIKDKILGITSGNHENRSYKESGVDLMSFLATKLGLIDRYDPIGICLFLRVGEMKKPSTGKPDQKRQVCYKIYMTHGSGGGRTEGAKINSLIRLQSVIDADIYIHSHTHQSAILPSSRLMMDARNNSIKEEEVMFINTSSSLSYGGYGERFNFKPTSTKQPIIYLCGSKKYFCASI